MRDRGAYGCAAPRAYANLNPGLVRDFTENHENVRELSGKSCLKLFIVNCIFVSIQVFSRSLLYLKC